MTTKMIDENFKATIKGLAIIKINENLDLSSRIIKTIKEGLDKGSEIKAVNRIIGIIKTLTRNEQRIGFAKLMVLITLPNVRVASSVDGLEINANILKINLSPHDLNNLHNNLQ